MDTLLQAVVIGIVQGLTEFLPISSSAHLILLPRMLGWDDAFLNSPEFGVMLHLGTLVALLVYFWRDLWRYARAGIRLLVERRIGDDPERRMALLLAASVIPAAVLGVLLEDFVESFFREQLLVVAMLLVVGAAILFAGERLARHERKMHELSVAEALAIGLAQALALFPGISRSGVTIAAGLFLRLERAEAARFTFLMGTPIIFGAGLWETLDLVRGEVVAFDPLVLAAGMVAATVAGLAAIAVLLAFLRRFSTDAFGIYRVGFAIVAAAVLLTR